MRTIFLLFFVVKEFVIGGDTISANDVNMNLEKGCNKLKVTPVDRIIYENDVGDKVADGGTAEIKCGLTTVAKYQCNEGTWEKSCQFSSTSCWDHLSNVGDLATENLNDGFYRSFPTKANFEEAKSACRNNCAQLVTVHSAKEETHVTQLFKNSGLPSSVGGTWIGMKRRGEGFAQKADTYWIDGSTDTYRGTWKKNNPSCDGCKKADKCTCETCVELRFKSTTNGIPLEWNDSPCSLKNNKAAVCAFYVEEK